MIENSEKLNKKEGEKLRCYFVIDMKSFFASVECADRGLDPMTAKLVVADETRTEKTICLAVSPALKQLGIKNRCRLFEIPKHLDYIIAPPRMKRYIAVAAEIYGIYLKYIDKSDIHVYSIDECIIDATDYLKIYKMRAKEFAQKLMGEIKEKLNIPSSAGIGTNMYLAKIALDITAKNSPDRIGWLTEERFIKTLWNHKPITDFWGISTGTAKRLFHLGILDMEGIARAKEDILYKEFGVNAELLIDHSFGKESCLMSDIKNYKTKSKSISSSQILPFNYKYEDGKTVLKEMVQEGCYRLKREQAVATNVCFYLGYGDDRTAGVKGAKRLNVPSNLFSQIMPYFDKLYDSLVDKYRYVRRLGISFSGLFSETVEQFDFFTDYEKLDKEKRLTGSIINIKDKYGKNAILKGVDFEQNATQRERNVQIGGHKSGESKDAENK